MPPNSQTQKKADQQKDQPFFMGQILELHIESLSYNGGRGVARLNGFVFFVPGVARSELVRAQITTVKKKFAECICLKVLEPATSRRIPPCSVANECGGCTWQHINYEQQVLEKKEIFSSFLRKIRQAEPIRTLPFVASKHEWHYRNRIQLQQRNSEIGYFKKQSHHFVPIKQCLIAAEEINHSLKNIPPAKSGRINVALTKENQVIFRNKNPENTYDLFSQVNNEQNHNLIAAVLKSIASIKTKNLFDFYCGSGNFSFPIAKSIPQLNVTAVEFNKASILLAKKENHLQNLTFIHADVKKFIAQSPLPASSIILIDPPRDGCHPEVLKAIAHSHPKQLIYISCNLATLVRDLNILIENGMTVVASQAFDMFPQTDHIESLTQLS